jgi:hypothetical protein
MRPTRVALVAASLLLAGACTSGEQPTSSPSASSSASVSPSASPSASTSTRVDVPPPPKDEACYRLKVGELTRPTSNARPVSCRTRHVTQTVYVGQLDTFADGHALAVDSAAAQRQLARACPRRLADYLGGTVEARRLSRFRVAWFSPTLQQSDQGANWFRCDVVAFARGDQLYPLPPPHRMHKVLDGDKALATYGLCGTAAPGSRSFERVICGLKHSWVAFSTIDIGGGKRFPGVSAVRRAGDATCKDRARARSDNSLKFSYGWEWPTREQWKAGQHYGYCWAPA